MCTLTGLIMGPKDYWAKILLKARLLGPIRPNIQSNLNLNKTLPFIKYQGNEELLTVQSKVE